MTNNTDPDRNNYIALSKEGTLLKRGDRITDFRGDHDKFISITRAPVDGSTGKVSTARGEFYPGVFDIVLIHKDEYAQLLDNIEDEDAPQVSEVHADRLREGNAVHAASEASLLEALAIHNNGNHTAADWDDHPIDMD